MSIAELLRSYGQKDVECAYPAAVALYDLMLTRAGLDIGTVNQLSTTDDIGYARTRLDWLIHDPSRLVDRNLWSRLDFESSRIDFVSVLVSRRRILLNRARVLGVGWQGRSTGAYNLPSIMEQAGLPSSSRYALPGLLLGPSRPATGSDYSMQEVGRFRELVHVRKARSAERRWVVWRHLLARDSMATLIGAFLILLFGVTIVGAMILRIPVTDIVSNSFWLVLGFFFGQGARRSNSAVTGSKRNLTRVGTRDGVSP
jgi:hypothetical protein